MESQYLDLDVDIFGDELGDELEGKYHAKHYAVDYTLCGLGLETARNSTHKINCLDCITIIEYCKKFRKGIHYIASTGNVIMSNN